MLYHINLDYQVIKGNQSKIEKMPYFQGKLAVCRGFKSPSRYATAPQKRGAVF